MLHFPTAPNLYRIYYDFILLFINLLYLFYFPLRLPWFSLPFISAFIYTVLFPAIAIDCTIFGFSFTPKHPLSVMRIKKLKFIKPSPNVIKGQWSKWGLVYFYGLIKDVFSTDGGTWRQMRNERMAACVI